MKKVLILVEGLTEERFIKGVVVPHLWTRGKHVVPTLVTTKRVKQGAHFKGGVNSYSKVENDLNRLLGDRQAVKVTTFIDYYGLPSDFPGMADRPKGKSSDRARYVEASWKDQIDSHCFHPFLMIHEFEALLFSKPEELSSTLHQPNILEKLFTIRNTFPSPEDINDDPLHAPSKRIINLLPRFEKSVHGPLVAQRIGLDILRKQCPHFNQWISWLEDL
jgi:hypothetical protein